jgi:hypothetical protein
VDSIDAHLKQLSLSIGAAASASAHAALFGADPVEEAAPETAGAVGHFLQAKRRNEPFLGLCGGFSAYDNCVCMRLFPLVLVATWTSFFRDECAALSLPPCASLCRSLAPTVSLSASSDWRPNSTAWSHSVPARIERSRYDLPQSLVIIGGSFNLRAPRPLQ